MEKKVIKKTFLSLNKEFTLVLHFKKHAIRLVLTSERGVIIWKTSRSENFVARARTTRVTAQYLGELMGKHMASLGVEVCSVVIKGPDYRASFTRAIIFSIVKHSKIKINRIVFSSPIKFGGTKFAKRANRKGKGKKKKKEKTKKKKISVAR
jgi:ribosomal protein S11